MMAPIAIGLCRERAMSALNNAMRRAILAWRSKTLAFDCAIVIKSESTR
jgi:hypothetical protein